MTASIPPAKPPVSPRPRSRPRIVKWGDVLVAGIGLAIALVLFLGSASMEVRGQSVPGPQFFPVAVGILLTATCGYLLVRAIIPAKRIPEHDDLRPDISRDLLSDVSRSEDQLTDLENVHHQAAAQAAKAKAEDEDAEGDFDWKAVSIAVVSVAAFILLLKPLGWILACTLLFAAVCFAFGSKRIWFNLVIGLFIGSLVQLLFSGLLGLALPSGFVGGIF
ncbi:tripartite tricarboxylate transporter TctB family protein [Galactobacter sp.]|uniref:tripartite tricarboxylate transporter TctB family protein n=1 Tax=Galactobacter sp. TaxID=2676125 RepID=UPI0025BE37A8|nr:tripartite tricarboxylate transporter TctB family protein [Galactobacter sp.]